MGGILRAGEWGRQVREAGIMVGQTERVTWRLTRDRFIIYV